jgi:hypothetical protein
MAAKRPRARFRAGMIALWALADTETTRSDHSVLDSCVGVVGQGGFSDASNALPRFFPVTGAQPVPSFDFAAALFVAKFPELGEVMFCLVH